MTASEQFDCFLEKPRKANITIWVEGNLLRTASADGVGGQIPLANIEKFEVKGSKFILETSRRKYVFSQIDDPYRLQYILRKAIAGAVPLEGVSEPQSKPEPRPPPPSPPTKQALTFEPKVEKPSPLASTEPLTPQEILEQFLTLAVPRFMDLEGGEIGITLSNPTEYVIEDVSVDLSDVKSYLELSEYEVKFPPLGPGSRLEKEIHAKPIYSGSWPIQFTANLRYGSVMLTKEFKVLIAQKTPSIPQVQTPPLESTTKVGWEWWLVPFFFGIIGGVIAWVGVREQNRKTANNLLIFGVVWSIILIYFTWVMYLWIFAPWPLGL